MPERINIHHQGRGEELETQYRVARLPVRLPG
jgi:hypothetical protein